MFTAVIFWASSSSLYIFQDETRSVGLLPCEASPVTVNVKFTCFFCSLSFAALLGENVTHRRAQFMLSGDTDGTRVTHDSVNMDDSHAAVSVLI